MFKKKKIILSYDYELFFGDKSGTVIKSIIEPTNALLDAMDSVDAKGNFFVDWMMIKCIKEANTELTDIDYGLLVGQLHDMLRRGHRIELHIHPHWVDAKYKGDGTWDFSNFQHYSLNSFSEAEIIDMFLEGTNFLTSIAREVDPDYEIVAFRAGGWAVQPFEKVRKGFLAAGIKIDSSPCKGFCLKNLHSFCDFRIMPNTSIYRFEYDICKENKNGQFICVPITSYKRHLLQGLVDRFTRYFTNGLIKITDGTHYRKEDDDAIKNGVLNVPDYNIRMLSLYTNPINIPLVLYQLRKRDMICMIQHPKDHTKLACITLKKILKYTDSITYKQLL